MHFNSVVLPEPDAPTIARKMPGLTFKLASSTANVRPPSNDLLNRSISIRAPGIDPFSRPFYIRAAGTAHRVRHLIWFVPSTQT